MTLPFISTFTSPSFLSVPEISAAISNIYVLRFMIIASFVLLAYDHCLTFSAELELIKPGRCSLPKLLFYLHRYVVVIGYFVVLLSILNTEVARLLCGPLGFFAGFWNIWIIVFSGASSTTKIWALFGRSARVLAFGTLLVIIAMLLFIVGMALEEKKLFLDKICILGLDGQSNIGQQLKWISVLLTDALPCILILHRTRRWRIGGIDLPLVNLLYRDTLWSLGVIIVANFINYLTFTILAPVNMIFTHPVVILTHSRLVLRMHEELYTFHPEWDDETAADWENEKTVNIFEYQGDSEWTCECPVVEGTVAESDAVSDDGHSSDLENGIKQTDIWHVDHTEACLAMQRQHEAIQNRHRTARRQHGHGYHRRPRARHLESMTFHTTVEDMEEDLARMAAQSNSLEPPSSRSFSEATKRSSRRTTRQSLKSSFYSVSFEPSTAHTTSPTSITIPIGDSERGDGKSREGLARSKSVHLDDPLNALAIIARRVDESSLSHSSSVRQRRGSRQARPLPVPPTRRLPAIPNPSTSQQNASASSTTDEIAYKERKPSGGRASTLGTIGARPRLKIDVSNSKRYKQPRSSSMQSHGSASTSIFVTPKDAPPLPLASSTIPLPNQRLPRLLPRVPSNPRITGDAGLADGVERVPPEEKEQGVLLDEER